MIIPPVTKISEGSETKFEPFSDWQKTLILDVLLGGKKFEKSINGTKNRPSI